MKFLLFAALIILTSVTAAQQVRLLTINELNNRMSKGKDTTFVINFWATWCAPCVKELPNFEALKKRNKTQKLEVLLVSLDFKTKIKNALMPFLKRKGILHEVFVLNERNEQEYIDRIDKSWSGAIPATLMIKEGKRTFFEKDFTYRELLKEYENIQ